MSTAAWIGLGSNLGDRRAYLRDAVTALDETPGMAVRAVSALYETDPVGGPARQPAYLNAAAALETTLDPLDLLRALQAIEARAGRTREQRWGSRTLDLDLLLYGSRIIRTLPEFNRVFGGSVSRLRVPHPRLAVRRFVLVPLAEIAPEAVEPWTGRTVADLLANLDRRPSLVAIDARRPEVREPVVARLQKALPGDVSHAAELLTSITDELELERRQPGEGLDFGKTILPLRECTIELIMAARQGGEPPTGPEARRWVICDAWSQFFDARHALEARWPEQREWFTMRYDTLPTPTFVAAIDGDGARQTIGTNLAEPPILTVEATTPEAIANEIHAACDATRGRVRRIGP
jgi:2-amino-4-hydroxy-6-hydroxymethyldihydropteridine diphosphokinase